MPLRLATKAERVLRFLLGLRNPRIVKALAAHGFTREERREGWALLQALGETSFDPHPPPPDRKVIRDLDAWENLWFPMAAAALERHHPAQHELLFLNLAQTGGLLVAISVRVFLDRLDAMARGEGDYGAEGPAAAALLARRGLEPSVLAEARALLAKLATVDDTGETLSVEEQQAEQARAELALWRWYLEWGQVARLVIKQRALLRQLGFRGNRAEAGADDEPSDPATEARRLVRGADGC